MSLCVWNSERFCNRHMDLKRKQDQNKICQYAILTWCKATKLSEINSKWKHSLLICTLISENQVLEKSRSDSNLRKFQVLQTGFFSVCQLIFFSDLYHKHKKNQVYRNWNFYKVWNRPWFIKTLIFRNQGAE